MQFDDRYSSAIRSSNLRSEAKTTTSSADVVGAAGLAAKEHPLAIALLRLFTGDNKAADEIIELCTAKLVGKAYRSGVEIGRPAASLIARLTLDWLRDSRCLPCGGHGFERIAWTPTLSDKPCALCRGSGRRDLEALVPPERVDLVRWLVLEMEREIGKAGPAAMARLAPTLELGS